MAWAVAVAVASLAGFAAAWVLAAHNRDLADISADFGPDRFLATYAVAGAVVASRRPSNPIGWLLLGTGLVMACRGLAGEYARYALAGPAHPAARYGRRGSSAGRCCCCSLAACYLHTRCRP
jgi:hypothetical protein